MFAQKANEISGSGKKRNEFEEALKTERDAFNDGQWHWQKIAWATAENIEELRLLESLELTELAEARLWKLVHG